MAGASHLGLLRAVVARVGDEEIGVGLVGTVVVVLLALVAVLGVVVLSQARDRRRRNAEALTVAAEAKAHPPREGDITMVCGPGLIADDVSPATLPLLGYRPELLRGNPLTRLVHPDDVAELSVLSEDPTAHGGSVPVRLRHHDGSWVWLLAHDATRHGRPGSVELYPREVPERVRAEEWLAAQRTLADVVLTMASDAYVATDERGTVVDWNRAAQTVLGWARDEVVGRSAVDLLVPPDRRTSYRDRVRELWQGRAFRVDEPTEAVVLRRDGSELPVEVTAWTVQVGRMRQLNLLIRDMTERKQVEQALREARERALDASRLKSEFLATMSHEIRTPMNGVIGLSGLLLETDLSQSQRRYVEGIRTAGDALLSVINDVLDFSKVEAGKLTLVEVDFDLREMVEDVVEVVAEPARAKGLELLGYVRPGVPVALRGDSGRLRQVLLNLASNAVKFTEHGEVVVRAELADDHSHAGVVIRFEVRDTGIGIAPDQRDRMFDAFSQADASTTRRFGGTGLGLAICRRLVELMKGRIGVISELGEGSTFWTEIPLHRQESVGTPTASRHHDLVGLRVLIVDNNATNRLILADQMRAWRMSPNAVDSGTAALTELREAARAGRGYDLAVLDMYMPGMDGIALAHRINADPNIPAVYLILLTSGPSSDVPGSQAAGISACLTKPVHQSELFDSLARVLGHGRKREQPTVNEAAVPSERSRGRVLLAEDNDINQQVALAMLQQLRYNVDTAADGEAAIELAREHQYDAILMDCQMPVMDGYTATAELRRLEGEQRHTPVIALTASARAQDRERCLAAGMDDYLAKPIRHEQMSAIMKRWVSSSESPPDPRVRAQIAERIDEIRSFDPVSGDNLVRGLVDSFLERAPAAVSAIEVEMRSGDGAAAGVHAHKLQGMAGNLGANELAESSAEISDAARDGHADLAQLERLRDDLDLAVAAAHDVRAHL